VIVDLGTGDGRAVLALAAADPHALALGIDSNAAAMAESSRRATRGRTRLHNAVFLVEAVELLPGPLVGVADLVTITMPWGSLLRGVLGRDVGVLAGVASIVRPGGSVEVLASVRPSDGIDGLAMLDEAAWPAISGAWRQFGFGLVERRPATRADLTASRSTWARRLGDRPIWRLVFDREWHAGEAAPARPRAPDEDARNWRPTRAQRSDEVGGQRRTCERGQGDDAPAR
jgi:16S rRNA (adenine(1408)-N(1))-methyltransferase